MTDRQGFANARVCILTTVHPPFDPRVFGKQAVSLAQAGFEVTLIAPHECREVRSGVHVVPLKRLATRLSRMLFHCWRAAFIAWRMRADVYHLHDPELLPVGLLLRAMGKRVVYDAHEDLPRQILSKSWIPQGLRLPLSWLLRGWLRIALRFMSGVIAATDGVADALGLPTRPTVVRNYPILESIPQTGGRGEGKAVRALYLGRVSEVRGAMEMIAAIELLRDVPIELTMMGFVSDRVSECLQAVPSDTSVTYFPWAPAWEAWRMLESADIGLVCLHPLPRFLNALPVKLFEYMASGIPVVASDFPLWREIVDGADCGLLVDPLDPSAIADALQYLANHPEERNRLGRNGRAAVEAQYSWEEESLRLLAFYDQVLCGAGDGPLDG